MANKTRVLLLCCGSFNPITNMHLRMFELARDNLHRLGIYEVVGGIISPVNDNYGKKDLLSAKHRCEMVDLALKTNDWVKLDCWESDQDAWIPTAKVLDHHQNILNSITNANNTSHEVTKKQKLDDENLNSMNNNESQKLWDLSQSVRIMLLCGADILESFGVPDLWEEADLAQIIGKHGLVVITRNGVDPHRLIYESDLLSKYQNNIHIVTEWILNDISSTYIRRAIRRGESIKYLVPNSVIQYIRKCDLYQPNNKYHVSFTEFYDSPNFNDTKKVCDDMLIEYEQETAV